MPPAQQGAGRGHRTKAGPQLRLESPSVCLWDCVDPARVQGTRGLRVLALRVLAWQSPEQTAPAGGSWTGTSSWVAVLLVGRRRCGSCVGERALCPVPHALHADRSSWSVCTVLQS